MRTVLRTPVLRTSVPRPLLFILLCGVATAHPHVFIDVGARLNFSGTKLTGIHIDWLFDQMYSYDIITSMTDGDMEIDVVERNEIEEIFNQSFGLLSYLTVIERNGQVLDIQEVLDFDVIIEEGRRVRITFTIPYFINVTENGETIDLSFHDESLYHGLTPQTGTPEFTATGLNVEVTKRNDISFRIKMRPK